MENTGTYFETETEKLASAINNLANAIDRLNKLFEPTILVPPFDIDEKQLKEFRSKEDIERTDYTDYPYSKKFQSITEDTIEKKPVVKKNLTTEKSLEDTPEEWEKKFNFLYGHLYIQNEDGEFCKINGETEDIIDFIKQLLEERENRARGRGFREGADIVEGHYIRKIKKLEKKLSKLNKYKEYA